MDDMIGKKVYFKGYTSFKPELYPFETKVVGKTEMNCLLLIDHPNGNLKEIDGVPHLVVPVRKEDLEIIA